MDDGQLLPLERASQLVGDLLVFHRDDIANQGGRGAVAVVDRGPFDSGGAASADDEALRQLVQHDGMIGVDDLLAVVGKAFDRTRSGAGVDDDVLALDTERRASVFRSDANGVVVEQLAAAQEDRNLVLLVEEIEQALVLSVDDLERAIESAVVVEVDVALDVDAEFGRALDLVEDIGRLQECLGGNAAAMEAGAPENQFLDHGHFETELCRANRRHIAAGAAAEQDKIELQGCGSRVGHGCVHSS